MLLTFEWRNKVLAKYEADASLSKEALTNKKRSTDISLVKGLTKEYLNKIYVSVPDKKEI